jgi:DNA polymerase (family 10)
LPASTTTAKSRPAAAAERRTFETEAEVYDFLGLPFIEPELREDRGEIEAALGGRLPSVVRRSELRGDCHTHSNWSDGHVEIARMAELARAAGLSFQVLTDHTQSLAIANGLTPERVDQQRRIVAELNEGYARDGVDFRLLHGCELEIRPDGVLDYPDSLLGRYDVVVCSLHVGRRQPRAQLMAAIGPRCAARTSTSLPTPPVVRSVFATTSTSIGRRSIAKQPRRARC